MSWYEYLFGSSSKDQNVEIAHTKLGNIKFEDEGWWRGTIKTELGPIDVFVHGTDDEVDESSADYCFYVASNLKEYNKKAMELITAELEISDRDAEARFTPDSLSSISKDRERSFFYMCFKDNEDEFAIWRVQFDKEVATYLSCDR